VEPLLFFAVSCIQDGIPGGLKRVTMLLHIRTPRLSGQKPVFLPVARQ
jgi:hypothetical protein